MAIKVEIKGLTEIVTHVPGEDDIVPSQLRKERKKRPSMYTIRLMKLQEAQESLSPKGKCRRCKGYFLYDYLVLVAFDSPAKVQDHLCRYCESYVNRTFPGVIRRLK